MRYLGHLGVAARAASRANADEQATTTRPAAAELPEVLGLPEERAAAWRAWAASTNLAAPTPARPAERRPADGAATSGSRPARPSVRRLPELGRPVP